MARKSKRKPKHIHRSAGTAARALRMERQLRKQHALGRAAIEARESKTETSTKQFAESNDLSEHMVRKLKTFARAYSDEELDQLCALRRPNGLPLHWGYVNYLLAAESRGGKKARRKFEKLAAANGWTAPQMYAAIRREHGYQQGHGRSMLLPTDLETAVRQVADEGRAWCRRLKMLVDQLGDPGRSDRDSVVGELSDCLKKVSDAIRDGKRGLR